MSRTARIAPLVTAGMLCLLPLRADDAFDRAVEDAIDRGTQFLLKAVAGEAKAPDGKPVGGWKSKEGHYAGYPMGTAAIQVYALVKSDIPYNLPAVRQGIDMLGSMAFEKTYCVSLYIMALDAILSQMEIDSTLGAPMNTKDFKTFQQRLESATQWLVRARWPGRGIWCYGMHNRTNPRFDNSNTQFAILALAVGYKRKVQIPVEVWEEIAARFAGMQEATGPEVIPTWRLKEPEVEQETPASSRGPRTKVREPQQKPSWSGEDVKVFARGWSYMETSGANTHNVTFNMTCAGASSVLIAFDALKDVREFTGDKRAALEKSVRDGIGKIITMVNGRDSWGWGGLGGAYYSLYSLEKVGDIGGIEKFGDFDWYRVGATHLLSVQNKDLGCWGDNEQPGNMNYQTSLALLFLSRATDLTFHNRPMVRQMTGRQLRPEQRKETRDWVYLPDMKLEVPARRIFRKMRFLPTQRLRRMAEGVIKYYDPQHRSELIPILIETHERTPYKAVKTMALEGLTSITGLTGEDFNLYRGFMKQWEDISEAGMRRDRTKIPMLRASLNETSSPVLRDRAIWALMRTDARDALGELIECMMSPLLQTREVAYGAVTFISRQNLPFNPSGAPAAREKHVAAWRAWWETNR